MRRLIYLYRAKTLSLIRLGALVLVFALHTTTIGLKPAAAAAVTVETPGREFIPADVTVLTGDTIRWTNTGVLAHAVTADDGSFNSHPACAPGNPNTCLRPGESFEFRFLRPAIVPYYCKLHGGVGGAGMSGVLRIVDPPPSSVD